MKIRELIDKDFKIAFPTVLNENTGLSVGDIFDSSHSDFINELNKLYGVAEVAEKERITLKKFLEIFEEAECTLDFDPEIEQELHRYIYKYPNQTSFRFCLIYYIVDCFIEDGPSDKQLVEFYMSTFENHPHLIVLDDFFSVTKFLLPILLCEKHPKELIDVFKDAIQRYPDKVYLKYAMSKIYETNKAYEIALNYALEFLGQLESEKIYDRSSQSYQFTGDFIDSVEDFHIGLCNAADLSFRIGDFKSTMIYCDKLLLEYQQFKNDTYSFQNLFIFPTVIRLRVFMLHSEEEFIKDYKLLKSKVKPEVLARKDYQDILDYAKKIKLD